MENIMKIQTETQQTQITNQKNFNRIKGMILCVIMRRSRTSIQFLRLTLKSHDLIKICLGSRKNPQI